MSVTSVFVHHVLYLSTMEHFDYGYNMLVNLATGATTMASRLALPVHPAAPSKILRVPSIYRRIPISSLQTVAISL